MKLSDFIAAAAADAAKEEGKVIDVKPIIITDQRAALLLPPAPTPRLRFKDSTREVILEDEETNTVGRYFFRPDGHLGAVEY